MTPPIRTPRLAALLTTKLSSRPLTLVQSAPYFATLLVVALIAFWPTYLSRVTSASGYTHLHALTATSWMLLLIAQPALVHARRLDVHRLLGRASYVIAPLVVVSMVLLAHRNTSNVGLSDIDRLSVFVPLSLAVLFGLSYGLAIVTRRTMSLHARFMVCTGLTLVDPVGVRLLFWANPTSSWPYQWATFALTDLIFLALIWRERQMRTARLVFPVMLGLFALAQAIFVFHWFETPMWENFVRWFLALDLT